RQGQVENIASAVVKDSENRGRTHSQVQGKQITAGSALTAAIEKNRVLHVKTLLQLGADANDWAFGNSALMLAAKKLNPEMVDLLLEHGAEAAVKGPHGKTALQLAEGIRETAQNAARRRAVIERLRGR